ncbi:MAG: hypothetical protein HC840_01100 [Leptolyngbyaceae cyanobacterium RM2_2_4]|nr:hypothetical protein [Leptolyngbyaceae cyanobacterium RM2_2_4]
MSNQQADKRTASQRIDDMERGLMALYQTADNMARDLMTVKEAIKLLGNKLDSVVKASSRGEALTDEVIAKIMVENNVEELKEKVTNLVNQGVLVAAEEVGPNSFIVGRELADDGTVQNPRMQFVVSALQPEVRDKFPGAKAGQTLELQEGKWKFEVQEVYNIQTPEQAAPQAQAEQASESTQAES